MGITPAFITLGLSMKTTNLKRPGTSSRGEVVSGTISLAGNRNPAIPRPRFSLYKRSQS